MQGKLPLAWEMIRALVRPLAGVMGPFFSFVGVEGGKVRPRAAVVAGLVAALALLAVLRGGPTASAVVPPATPTLTQSPAGGTAVDPGPGNTISYVITLNMPSTFNPNASTAADTLDRITVDFAIDTANFFITQLSCFAPSGPSTSTTGFTAPEVGCEWREQAAGAGLPAGIYVFAVLGYAKPGADNKVGSPADIKFCYDQNGNKDCDDEPAANQLSVNVDASVGVLDINPNTVSPATTTVAPGTPVTITWTLQDGYTCETDTTEDVSVTCGPGDVVLSPATAAAILSGPSVVDDDIADETTVSVTIINSAPGPVTVVALLKTHFHGDHTVVTDNVNPNQVGVDDVVATVTFAAAPGRLMGDVDCDNNVTAADALKILRYLAGLPVVQNEPCPDIGTPQ